MIKNFYFHKHEKIELIVGIINAVLLWFIALHFKEFGVLPLSVMLMICLLFVFLLVTSTIYAISLDFWIKKRGTEIVLTIFKNFFSLVGRLFTVVLIFSLTYLVYFHKSEFHGIGGMNYSLFYLWMGCVLLTQALIGAGIQFLVLIPIYRYLDSIEFHIANKKWIDERIKSVIWCLLIFFSNAINGLYIYLCAIFYLR